MPSRRKSRQIVDLAKQHEGLSSSHDSSGSLIAPGSTSSPSPSISNPTTSVPEVPSLQTAPYLHIVLPEFHRNCDYSPDNLPVIVVSSPDVV